MFAVHCLNPLPPVSRTDNDDDDDDDDDDDGDDGEREMHFCDAAIARVKSGRLICTKVVSLPVGASDGDDDNSSMMVTVRTMRMKKIPSEMGVAPPHKRFTQFSTLIKL